MYNYQGPRTTFNDIETPARRSSFINTRTFEIILTMFRLEIYQNLL